MVDVWVLDIPHLQSAYGSRHCLSDDEIRRMQRFRRDEDQIRYAVGRTALRHILSGYCDSAPLDIEFSLGGYGKPQIDGATIYFNVSHSQDCIVIAVSLHGPVGVDVEYHKSMSDMMALAKRFFSEAEYTALLALPEAMREHGFFRVWTRKEAYIKCIGRGIGYGLDRFSVSAGKDASLLGVPEPDGPVERWAIRDIVVPDHYSGAVVLDLPSIEIRYRTV